MPRSLRTKCEAGKTIEKSLMVNKPPNCDHATDMLQPSVFVEIGFTPHSLSKVGHRLIFVALRTRPDQNLSNDVEILDSNPRLTLACMRMRTRMGFVACRCQKMDVSESILEFDGSTVSVQALSLCYRTPAVGKLSWIWSIAAWPTKVVKEQLSPRNSKSRGGSRATS
jgi:hypothetical protein